MRRLLLIAIFIGGMVFSSSGRGALAQEECAQPPAPKPVNGASVSEQQMRAAAAAARNFIAQSNLYQACLTDALDAARTEAAAAGKPADARLEESLRARAAAAQKAKEDVGARINAALIVYKKTHVK